MGRGCLLDHVRLATSGLHVSRGVRVAGVPRRTCCSPSRAAEVTTSGQPDLLVGATSTRAGARSPAAQPAACMGGVSLHVSFILHRTSIAAKILTCAAPSYL